MPLASTNQEVLAAFATQDSPGMAPPVRVRKSIVLWHNNEAHHFSMKDIDECLTGDHFCHGNTTCSNEVGGYSCICNIISTNSNGSIHTHYYAQNIPITNCAVTAITRLWLILYAGTRAQMQTGSAVVMPIVLIAAGGSFIVTLVVSIVVGLVCVKLRKTRKTDTRYC